MSQFIRKKINYEKIITIINVGSYKVRAIICSFSSLGIKILGYGEKRQSRLDVINNEINNLVGISETIKNAISKAEIDAGVSTDEMIVNPFFSNTFFYSKTVLHKQKDNTKPIDEDNLFEILSKNQRISLFSMENKVKTNYGLSKEELVLILSNLVFIEIDGKKENKLLGKKGEDLSVRMLNCFILKSDLETINDIANFVGKKIIKIIPEEYSVTKVGNELKDIIFINIGNSITNISFKSKEGYLIDTIKLNIGIGDLVKDIKQNNSSRSRGEIIKKLDREDLFKNEKKEFLALFKDILIGGIKEILSGNVCPNNFILMGGGANNKFIKDYITEIDFINNGIKLIKKINFLDISIDNLKKINGVENILNISNIDLISQVLSAEFILDSKNDRMEEILKKVIRKTN